MAVHTTVVKGSASAVIDKLAVAKPSFKQPSAKPFKLEYTKPSFKPLNMAVEAVIIVDVFKSETEAEFLFNIKKSAFF